MTSDNVNELFYGDSPKSMMRTRIDAELRVRSPEPPVAEYAFNLAQRIGCRV